MKGAFVVELAARDVAAARTALARAVASGALGPGYAVKRDGDGLSFAGGARGRIDVASDGRVVWTATVPASLSRWATAVSVAALVAAAATIGWSARFPTALAVGIGVAIAYALVAAQQDRARVRRRLRALVDSLAVLVDARGE